MNIVSLRNQIFYHPQGKKHGKGKLKWADGSFYSGEFYEGRIEGRGFYKWPDGRSYEGEWLNDQR